MRRGWSEICRPERPLRKAELHRRRTERQSTDSTRRRARTAEHKSAVKIGRTGTTVATLQELLKSRRPAPRFSGAKAGANRASVAARTAHTSDKLRLLDNTEEHDFTTSRHPSILY